MKRLIFIFFVLSVFNGRAQNPEMDVHLLEVNFEPGSGAYGVVEFQENIYFIADDEVHGRELWGFSGEEPYMVYDIEPGEEHAFYYNNQGWYIPGTEFFLINTHNDELWKSDGTESGTVKLLTNYGSNPVTIYAELDSEIFFGYDDGVHGTELWKTDGTPEGTVLVKDIYEGPYSGVYSNMVNFKGDLYFYGSDDVHGIELWKSDGTAEGTFMLKDINPGENSSGHYDKGGFLMTDDYLFFYADTVGYGNELWVSDGTAEGTRMVKDIYPGTGSSSPWGWRIMGAAGNEFIVFRVFDSPYYDGKLWISDGTEAGTYMISDFNGAPGVYNSMAFSFGINEVNGKFFFEADGGESFYKLWVTDGTPGGTYRFADLDPGKNEFFEQPAVYNGQLYFKNKIGGDKIFVTNGSDLRVFLDWSNNHEVNDFVPLDDKIYFSANQYFGISTELMECKEGNQDFRILPVNTRYSGEPAHFANLNGKTLFFANSDGSRKMHITDGSPQGTHIILENPGFYTNQYRDENLYRVGGNLYFATDETFSKLVKTDGTPEGTGIVLDASEGAAPRMASSVFGRYNGVLYFSAGHEDTAYDLFRSDGTPEGTYRVKNLSGSPEQSAFILSFEEWKGELYFSGSLQVQGYPYQSETIGIWKTDGTEEGTEFIIHVPDVGLYDHGPDEIRALGDKLFFIKREFDQQSYGPSTLYVTDGTQENIERLWGWEFNTIGDYHNGASLIRFNDKLFFSSHSPDGMPGFETIVVSDGTAAGTHPLDSSLGFDGIRGITKCGKFLYFFTGSSTNVDRGEIWKTDGTSENTFQITDYLVDKITGASCYKGNFVFVEAFEFSDGFGVSDSSGEYYVRVNTEEGYDIENYEGLKGIFGGEENLYFNLKTVKRGAELYGADPDMILSTEEINEILIRESYDILIYPNPAQNEVNLKTLDNSKIRQVQIYEMTGRLNEIVLMNSESARLNTENYKPGIYILKITTDKNTFGKKVIIK